MTKGEILNYLLQETKGIVNGSKLKNVIDKVLSYVDSNIYTPSTPAYKVYSFKYHQQDENNPVPVILENTLGSNPIWTRIESALYTCASPLFVANKVMIIISTSRLSPITAEVVGNTIEFDIPDGDGVSNLLMEIRVYN